MKAKDLPNYQTYLEHYRKKAADRKREGLCTRCGALLTGSLTTCPDCIAKHRRIAKSIRDKRRAGHICTRCGAPLPEGSTRARCEACLSIDREQFKRRMWERINNHQCVTCKAALPEGWKQTRCGACIEKERARYITRASDPDRWWKLKVERYKKQKEART